MAARVTSRKYSLTQRRSAAPPGMDTPAARAAGRHTPPLGPRPRCLPPALVERRPPLAADIPPAGSVGTRPPLCCVAALRAPSRPSCVRRRLLTPSGRAPPSTALLRAAARRRSRGTARRRPARIDAARCGHAAIRCDSALGDATGQRRLNRRPTGVGDTRQGEKKSVGAPALGCLRRA